MNSNVNYIFVTVWIHHLTLFEVVFLFVISEGYLVILCTFERAFLLLDAGASRGGAKIFLSGCRSWLAMVIYQKLQVINWLSGFSSWSKVLCLLYGLHPLRIFGRPDNKILVWDLFFIISGGTIIFWG